MSQLLSRVGKPLVCKNILRHNINVVRWCSSMPTYPYMLLDYMLNLADSWKDSSDGHITIGKCSSKEQKHIEIKASVITDDVRNVMSLGYYNGALKLGMLEKEYLTSTNNVRLYIKDREGSTTSSTLGLHNEDWVVAIKFNGPQIKLYRPACPTESMWTNVKAMPRSISTSSSLMYSKKDQRFYVPTPGSDYLYSLDPNSKENDHLEAFGSRCGRDELVCHNSPLCGGSFRRTILRQMDQLEIDDKGLEQVTRRTGQFMVYRAEDHPRIEEHRKELSYTEDIGDFCIFLGQGEPFCVRASMHPGLRANYIYFSGYNLLTLVLMTSPTDVAISFTLSYTIKGVYH
ncbi:hypothetical protein IGI04_035018 [Brassica rapa subsp. trilocularis]|uniref:KIB1-4 beta-propeller domain-containing protein n=1 Tax=Brassica rapa subsp. trilocularis TaxID=1813537 RepID=A0ABQ7LDI1_BRACM|nr:hypothetical protein IGI04_035018 [Brassica rapa subsp. trilocularis]